MNLQELREWVKRRLARKARQAEQAYISEFTVKSTQNCLNHGTQLGESTWHCKINAMGLHEQGASQCWNQKARVCPLFELARDKETLRRDFRKMSPNQLAIRWPSLGELIRFDHVLSLVEIPEAEGHAEAAESRVRLRGDVQLPPQEDETGAGPSNGDVRGEHCPGRSDSSSSDSSSVDTSGESDSGSSEHGAGHPPGLSLATFSGPRDRSGSN